MSSQSKTVAGHPEPTRPKDLYRVAIVGAASLKGKDVAEVLNDRNFPALETKLLDDDESIGQLETLGDEISFIQSVRSEQFDKIDFTFFASDPESTRKNWKKVRDNGSAIVDLSAALEDEPGAVVRSPWIERQLSRTLTPELQPGPSVVAHPASVVLALLLLRLQKAGAVKSVVTTVFEPASEHAQKGMDELHQQTVNLLSFQELPKKIFDTQVAFNLITRYGDQSMPPLQSVEQRIARHYQRIAGKDAPGLSLLLVQAPIFHGYAFAVHAELGVVADLERVSQAIAGDHVHVVLPAEDSPSNVSVAGQTEIQVSIRPDAANQNSVWLWAAADNLRIAATNAVECAETMVASRPRGKIQ
jgi:aspartate-semialdehyde dehydrogenase